MTFSGSALSASAILARLQRSSLVRWTAACAVIVSVFAMVSAVQRLSAQVRIRPQAISSEPIVIGYGPGSGGTLNSIADASTGFATLSTRTLPWAEYNAVNGALHPASGDLDGDIWAEVVVGLGRGGEGYLAILDDAVNGYALLTWVRVPWSEYNTRNGSTWPAVGDVDGDGRAEIVVGLGEGGEGLVAIFDDFSTGHSLMTWRRVSWPDYNLRRGETRPAVANIDGGAYSEIVVGLGPGGAGWLEVLDDAAAGFASLGWLRCSYTEYNDLNGETFPAAGDLDGDGFDEIALGLGRGSRGFVEILDDGLRGFVNRGWGEVAWHLQRGWSELQSRNELETHPAIGNVDADGLPEIVLGFGETPAQEGWIEILDDASRFVPYEHLAWKRVSTAAEPHLRRIGTYPAVGRFR